MAEKTGKTSIAQTASPPVDNSGEEESIFEQKCQHKH